MWNPVPNMQVKAMLGTLPCCADRSLVRYLSAIYFQLRRSYDTIQLPCFLPLVGISLLFKLLRNALLARNCKATVTMVYVKRVIDEPCIALYKFLAEKLRN